MEDLLNPHQRRHFEIMLSTLETELTRIERVAHASAPGTLTWYEEDLAPEFLPRAQPLLDECRLAVRTLADRLRLSPRALSRRRRIRAILTTAVIRIDDSMPRQLRGYGPVSPRVEAEVVPALASLREALVRIRRLIEDPPPDRSITGPARPWTSD